MAKKGVELYWKRTNSIMAMVVEKARAREHVPVGKKGIGDEGKRGQVQTRV